ncbi:MAG: DUF6221 family protein [Burkholderiales bacterium]
MSDLDTITLPTFVLARIADWEEEANGTTTAHPDDRCYDCGGNMDGLVLWPSEVLATCKAYRSVLERWAAAQAKRRRNIPDGFALAEAELRAVVRILAATWSDHPDFNPEWSLNA